MTEHTFDVCVLGSFMKDLVAEAPRRPLVGETIRGHGFHEFLGGKGVNQAVAAARLGARTAMIGRLGADRYGDEFAELLVHEGIDASQVGRDSSQGTGVGLPVVEPDGSNSIIIVPRANDAVRAADVAAAAGIIQASKVLLVQLELPVESALEALRLAHSAGVTTVFNPAPYLKLPDEIADLVDVIVPNEIEATQLTGVPCDDDKVAEVALRVRREAARRGAVLTLGARGAVVVDRGDDAGGDNGNTEARGREESANRSPRSRVDVGAGATDEGSDGWRTTWLPAFPVEPVDTVGAGDAFCGALAARLAAGDPLLAAAGYASVAGALATTRPGAAPAMPRHSEVDALLTKGDWPPPRPVRRVDAAAPHS